MKIVVILRETRVEPDIFVCIDGQPGKWACGSSMFEALGRLAETHYYCEFGLIVKQADYPREGDDSARGKFVIENAARFGLAFINDVRKVIPAENFPKISLLNYKVADIRRFLRV